MESRVTGRWAARRSRDQVNCRSARTLDRYSDLEIGQSSCTKSQEGLVENKKKHGKTGAQHSQSMPETQKMYRVSAKFARHEAAAPEPGTAVARHALP